MRIHRGREANIAYEAFALRAVRVAARPSGSYLLGGRGALSVAIVALACREGGPFRSHFGSPPFFPPGPGELSSTPDGVLSAVT